MSCISFLKGGGAEGSIYDLPQGLFGTFFWPGQVGQVDGQKSHLGPPSGSRPSGLGSQKSSPYPAGWSPRVSRDFGKNRLPAQSTSAYKPSSAPSFSLDTYRLCEEPSYAQSQTPIN